MEEEISSVLESCSQYMNEPDDHELELSAHDSTKEWDSNSQKDSAKRENGFDEITSTDNALFKQRKGSGIPEVQGKQNPEICRVIQLLWSKQAIKSLAKELELKV
jgi:hypothetical protein